ncbi:MAG TPA: thioredoxin family protein [Ideonella sp.]|uniref:thioredoxin family protein n=1 Tax=Ideonella sp. TaxID=1929293 RepID=UPI002BC7B0F5|nr:thioredoxin family protein [Ideonella sp.]HSI48664.1 thioredoxin family protein [Ideonella sp.]
MLPVRLSRARGWVVRALALLLALWLALMGHGTATAGSGWVGAALSGQQLLPALDGATAWLNSAPLDAQALRGKVVLVDFWTYSCINCLRTLPYVRAWAQKYGPSGLVVLGVHTPEFDFERALPNVQRAVKDLGITYPVAVDSQQALWRAFGNRAWPAFYFVDASGRIRDRQLGEGRYERAERMIQQLLREAGRRNVPEDLVAPQGEGTQAAAGPRAPASDETYLGAARAEGFVATLGQLRTGGRPQRFSPAPRLDLNQWTLAGNWRVGEEQIEAPQAGAHISYRFRARDLHLVLGPGQPGRSLRFRVRIDGKAPGADHGSDTDAEGNGRIDAQRLYQLVRQSTDGRERLFDIEFLDEGAQAFSVTFG